MQLALNDETILITKQILLEATDFKTQLINDFRESYQSIALSDDLSESEISKIDDDDLLFLYFKTLLENGEDLTSGEGLYSLIATLRTNERFSTAIDRHIDTDETYNVFVSNRTPMPIIYKPRSMSNISITAPSADFTYEVIVAGVMQALNSIMDISYFDNPSANHSMVFFQMGRLSGMTLESDPSDFLRAKVLLCAHLILSAPKDQVASVLYAFLVDLRIDVAVDFSHSDFSTKGKAGEVDLRNMPTEPCGSIH